MSPAASVHVPAQHLEPENCSGPEVPTKDDPLWPAWVWDSEWPKPGYMIISDQGRVTWTKASLVCRKQGAGGAPIPLLCLPTTAPALASLSPSLA